MAIFEKHGAKGSIKLKWDWQEDSQGISEYYNECAEIQADSTDDAYVIMTVQDGEQDMRKGRRQSITKFKIKATDLISLIKNAGTKI